MRASVRPFRRAAVSAATLALAAATLVAVAPGASSAPEVSPRGSVDGTWTQVGAGFNVDDTLSQVFQLTSREQFPDLRSTAGPIYAAGTFVASGGATINRVAQDNGGGWTKLPGDDTGIAPGAARSETGGLPTPGVYGLVLGGDDSLYAGGSFWGSDDTLNNVGKWNGSDWRPMGFGLKPGTDVVQDMVMGNDFIGMDDVNYADDTVYAVGGFAGPCASLDCTTTLRAAEGVAEYSRTDDTWYALGNGTLTGNIYTGAYIDDTLYVGGQFSVLSGKAIKSVARWSNVDDTWLPLGGGLAVTSTVYAMAVHPITKDLYIGGYGIEPFGYPANFSPGIVKWDYSDDTWAAVGSGFVNPDVDDIAFSQDGTTMWVALDSPTVTPAGNVATLTNSDFANPSVGTITGTWNALTSGGVSGVGGPAPSGGVNQTSARAVYAIGNDSAMFGGNFHTAGAITAGRVARWSPPVTPPPRPPRPPSVAPGAPTSVTATAGVQSVNVTWTPPSYSGTQPITSYRATASPGGATCEVNALTCTFTELTVGTSYTFQVQAYNAAGWGDLSAPSNAVSPLAPPPPPVPVTVSIDSAERTVSGRGTAVTASVSTTGVDAGTAVVPWTRIGRGEWTPNSVSTLVLGSDGSVQWKRKFGANRNRATISIKFEVSAVFSDVTSLRPVK